MYKIVVTTPAGDFTFDKVYSSVSEANEYIETLYKHFDETASFKVVLADLSETKYKLEHEYGKPSKLTRCANQSYVKILPGCYFMLDENNQVHQVDANHFERFYRAINEDKPTNTFVERLEAMLDTFENKKDSMSNKELQQFALNLLKTSIMREKAHNSADKLLSSITGES